MICTMIDRLERAMAPEYYYRHWKKFHRRHTDPKSRKTHIIWYWAPRPYNRGFMCATSEEAIDREIKAMHANAAADKMFASIVWC